MTTATGDVRLRRFRQSKDIAGLPSANSKSIRTGDVIHCIAENVDARCVGNPGARSWFMTGSGSAGEPAHQIVYGTGSGLASDPRFTHDPATGRVKLFDENNKLLVELDALAADRKVWVYDENGFAVTFVSGRAALRTVDTLDPTGNLISEVDTKAAARTFTLYRTDGATPFFIGNTRTLVFTFAGGARVAQRDIGAGTTAGLVSDYVVSFTSGAVAAYQAIAMGVPAGQRAALIFQDTSFASAYGVALANPHTIHCLAGKKLNNVVDGTATITTGGGSASFVVDDQDNMIQLGGA